MNKTRTVFVENKNHKKFEKLCIIHGAKIVDRVFGFPMNNIYFFKYNIDTTDKKLNQINIDMKEEFDGYIKL